MVAKSGNLSQHPSSLYELTLEPGPENRNQRRDREVKGLCLRSLRIHGSWTPCRRQVGLGLALPLTWNSNLHLPVNY